MGRPSAAGNQGAHRACSRWFLSGPPSSKQDRFAALDTFSKAPMRSLISHGSSHHPVHQLRARCWARRVGVKPMSAPEGNDNVVSAAGAQRGPNSTWTNQGRLPREVRRKRQGSGSVVHGRRRDKSKDPEQRLGAAMGSGRPALATQQRPKVLRRVLRLMPPSWTPSSPRAPNQNYSHAASDICSNQFVIIRK